MFFLEVDPTLLSLQPLDSILCIITVIALISFQHCNRSVLERSSRQTSFEILDGYLDLYIPT